MISQGSIEQTPFTSGYNRTTSSNSGRILETNTDNLLRMVLNLRVLLFFNQSTTAAT